MSRPAPLSILARILVFIGLLTLAPAVRADRIPIDQVPMYGPMDRSKIPYLKKADEDLVRNGIKGFGSREKAAEAWFSVGLKYYRNDDLANAMRRFNQAWLLNPADPRPFWGFAMVRHDQGKAIEAEKYMARAFELGFREAVFLTDYGRVCTVITIEDPKLSVEAKAAYLKKSDEMYALSEQIDAKDEYLYGSWSTALFWRGDYPAAWEKVRRQRALGGQPGQKFLKLLSEKMSEPTN
jgi:tetratricopeptide (TPR) repeat protein